MEKLSLVKITDMNQTLLSKYFCDFNQMIGNETGPKLFL